MGTAYNAGMPVEAALRERVGAAQGGSRPQELYDEDFWGWTREQADALRRRDIGGIDWENVIEEIETLGRSEEHAWTALCTNVLSHLLKMEYSGKRDSVNHWSREIRGYRRGMHRQLRRNPGLKGKLDEMLQDAWEDGREDAVEMLTEHDAPGGGADERRLRKAWRLRLPEECPYELEDIAGCDPHDRGAAPKDDVWPPTVARRLDRD